MIMRSVTAGFASLTFYSASQLFLQDKKNSMPKIGGNLFGLYLLVKMLLQLLPEYLSYYRKDFHPAKINYSRSLRYWKQRMATQYQVEGFQHARNLHALAAALLLALLGILGGLWAQKMDQLGAVTSFVVTPLTFLSGTFYSAVNLPPLFQAVIHANPFFYMIDGFRYGITGHADGALIVGLAVMGGTNLLLVVACYRIVATGWRLKP